MTTRADYLHAQIFGQHEHACNSTYCKGAMRSCSGQYCQPGPQLCSDCHAEADERSHPRYCDCGERKPLREYEKDNLAGTAVLHIEICQECYEERTC